MAPADASFTAPAFSRRSPITSELRHPTYDDAVVHLDRRSAYLSPCVSASFSLVWAVWEALRRYHFNAEEKVEIAVIDACALVDRAATVEDILQSCRKDGQHANHERWYRAAHVSQSTLIYGAIPPHAILASIPLLRVLRSLPPHSLRPPASLGAAHAPLAPIQRVIWSYGARPSFRRFVEEQSGHFRRAAPEDAVRLALALLGVWFLWMLRFRAPPGYEDEREPSVFRAAAVAKVRELVGVVAVWPAPETPDGETHHEALAGEVWEREVAQLVAEVARLVAEPVGGPHERMDTHSPNSSPASDTEWESNPESDAESELTWVDEGEARSWRLKGKELGDCEPQKSAVDPQVLHPRKLPPHGPARCEPKKHLKPGVSDSVEVERMPPLVIPPTSSHHALRVLTIPKATPSHPTHETASALLTGFFFGALVVISLSTQRNPALLLVS